MKDPDIQPLVRYVFHARSEQSWPERSEQFNVAGDIWAARTLLARAVPLVWIDTGDQIRCPTKVTEERLAPCGDLGRYLHEYRGRSPYFQDDKGFFDLGDIAWMIDPDVCRNDIVEVPGMDWLMRFRSGTSLGRMLRVHDIDPVRTWECFFERMHAAYA